MGYLALDVTCNLIKLTPFHQVNFKDSHSVFTFDTHPTQSHSLTLHCHSHSPCTVTVTHLALSPSITLHCHSHSPCTVTFTLLTLSPSLTLHCHSHSPCTVTEVQSEWSLCPIQLPALHLYLPDAVTSVGVSLREYVVLLLKSLFSLLHMNQEAVGWPESLGGRQVNDTCPPTATVTSSGLTVA